MGVNCHMIHKVEIERLDVGRGVFDVYWHRSPATNLRILLCLVGPSGVDLRVYLNGLLLNCICKFLKIGALLRFQFSTSFVNLLNQGCMFGWLKCKRKRRSKEEFNKLYTNFSKENLMIVECIENASII